METTLQVIKWKDTKEEQTVLIGICEMPTEDTQGDEEIFFYVENMQEIKDLKKEDNGQDFIIL